MPVEDTPAEKDKSVHIEQKEKAISNIYLQTRTLFEVKSVDFFGPQLLEKEAANQC